MTKVIKSDKDQAVAFQFFNQLKELIKKQGLLYLSIGRLLKIIRDEKYYIHKGYDTWLGFVNGGEVTIKQSTIYAYISIYEMYVLKYGIKLDALAEIPWDKLHLAIPAIRRAEGKEEVEEWVVKADKLSRSDLKIEVGEVEPISGAKTTLIKAFKCDDCGKLRIDLDKKEICNCN